MQYAAALVCGGLNGIIIFEWQQRLKPNVTHWFDIPSAQIDQKLPQQHVTQISFNPNKSDQLCGSGPKGNLAFYAIEQNCELKRIDSVVGVKEIAKQDDITGHVWHEEGDYIVSCTSTGKLIVSNLLKSEVA